MMKKTIHQTSEHQIFILSTKHFKGLSIDGES